MENSQAYKYLVEQIEATGSKKCDGYYPGIMEEIYDWERNEVEDIIWNAFHKTNDTDLAEFMPKLKKYDGMAALKKRLSECTIPSDSSVIIAKVLYDCTVDKKYLDVIKSNIDKNANKISNVAILSYARPSKELYNLLIDVYINNDNKVVRSTAVTGILYYKGFISNPHDMQEIIEKLELRRMFAQNSKEERKKVIVRFESGELEKYK